MSMLCQCSPPHVQVNRFSHERGDIMFVRVTMSYIVQPRMLQSDITVLSLNNKVFLGFGTS